ncbi:hypothetical protein DY000_02036318 [Brassica cretica]|uniref:Uncharacterized protein n=1 Tax=Brassica cretica TaxID=69181 RepID=A0ABQ7BDS0_BRACR|nr:hypothetical protein DY000_02036318 [Brassica cretica]
MLYTAVKTNSVAIRELLEGDDSHGNRVYTGKAHALQEDCVDRLCCDIPEKEIQRRYTCPWSPNVVKALTPALTAASHSSHDLRFNASLTNASIE